MRLASSILLAIILGAIQTSCGDNPTDNGEKRSPSALPVESSNCSEQRQALTKVISDHKQCLKDSDCRGLVSFCLHEGRADCTGTFYVNASLSTEAFGELDGALSRCAGGMLPECGTCAKEAAAPACIEGVCSMSTGSR